MAILVSPGESITVTDESVYVSGAVGSVPLVVLATAENKVYNGAVASGTTKANAGLLQAFTSQRDLVSALGQPVFQQSSAGIPLNANEINEYGLMAAYSALGVGNQLYAIRADIDLNQLVATNNRPQSNPANGAYWLNLNTTSFGLNLWNYQTGSFSTISPIYVTQSSQVTLNGSVNYPSTAVGTPGSYAVVFETANGAQDINNRLFYKATANSYSSTGNLNNQWVQVNSTLWQQATPTVVGTVAVSSPTASVTGFTSSTTVSINAISVHTGTTLQQFVNNINSANIPGVNAAISTSNTLMLFATSAAQSANNGTVNGELALAENYGSGGIWTIVGVNILSPNPSTFNCPLVSYGTYAQAPSWRSTDTVSPYTSGPTPSGSIFVMTSQTGGGADITLEQFNGTSATWTQLSVPLYPTPKDAIYGLDPAGGGLGIPAGSIFGAYVPFDTSSNSLVLYYRTSIGPTSVTGTIAPGASAFSTGNSFTIKTTAPNSDNFTTYTVTISGGTNANAFVSSISAANIPYVSATVNSNGTITISHATGGDMVFANVSGTPLTAAGFTASTTGLVSVNAGLLASNWSTFNYSVGTSQPYVAPTAGTYWYYGDATTVDIMINDNGWKGYRNVASDARGYNLTLTDANGVIVSASQPTTQSTGTALVAGDLWLNTADLIDYPNLYRYNGTAWVLINNTDHVSENGIIFADARWDTTGTSDIIEDALPSTVTMLTSNYLDLDAPNYKLYPRGALLFNTRRSGFTVKKYVPNYFNASSFPNVSLPSTTNAWVLASGYDNNDVANFGTNAQRYLVVAALKSAIDSNTVIREDQTAFNLICAPGYPELIPNMVNLNNDKANRAFVIGDTPMTLSPTVTEIDNWSNDSGDWAGQGLATGDPYLAVYYPAGQTTDLSGNPIVVPASHMMLSTYLYNDQVSYMWFAPAGVHRGLISNVSDIGYVDANSGEFVHNGINQGLRDALYQTNINPITLLPGVGIVAWGQKTRNPVTSALDRVNVARLVTYLRTIFATVGYGYLFEPNDASTRKSLQNVISSSLNTLVALRGLYDYVVICDTSNNTNDIIAQNQLYCDIAIEPMKDVEFIYIPIALYNPGGIKAAGL